MRRRTRLVLLALVTAAGSVGAYAVKRYVEYAGRHPDLFEAAVVKFEAFDRSSPPEPGGVVFVGSSSIRRWRRLEQDMLPLRVVKRGIDGSHLVHVKHNARRVVLAYEPRAVVVYAGETDLASRWLSKSVDGIVGDFSSLVALLHAELPELRIYFITIKPSPKYWHRWPEMDRANRRIADFAAEDRRITVLDVATPMLANVPGPPAATLYRADELHLSDAGYAIWTDVVRTQLLADLVPTPR